MANKFNTTLTTWSIEVLKRIIIPIVAVPKRTIAAPNPVIKAEESIAVQGKDSSQKFADEADSTLNFASMTWSELESSYVMMLLEKHKWNVSQAARAAGINRSTFDSRMKKLGITKGVD